MLIFWQVLLFCFTPLLAMAQTRGAIISIEKNEYDFGAMTIGQKAYRTFIVKNTGDEPLFITNIATTCACAVPQSIPLDAVKPGQRQRIVIVFNAMIRPGKQRSKLTLISNAVAGTRELMVTADVSPHEKPARPFWRFGK